MYNSQISGKDFQKRQKLVFVLLSLALKLSFALKLSNCLDVVSNCFFQCAIPRSQIKVSTHPFSNPEPLNNSLN